MEIVSAGSNGRVGDFAKSENIQQQTSYQTQSKTIPWDGLLRLRVACFNQRRLRLRLVLLA